MKIIQSRNMASALFVTVAGLFLGSIGTSLAAPVQEGVDYDKFETFSNLKTYAWHPRNDSSTSGFPPELHASGEGMIEATLQKKGLQKSTSGTPDVYLFYRVTQERKVEKFHVGSGRMGAGAEVEREYAAGTIVLDITNPTTNRTLWRGWVQAEVKSDLPMEERKSRIQKVIGKLLAKFPPK